MCLQVKSVPLNCWLFRMHHAKYHLIILQGRNSCLFVRHRLYYHEVPSRWILTPHVVCVALVQRLPDQQLGGW